MVTYFLVPLMAACGAVVLNAYVPFGIPIALAVVLTWFILYQLFG